jgi:hypothetical protein
VLKILLCFSKDFAAKLKFRFLTVWLKKCCNYTKAKRTFIKDLLMKHTLIILVFSFLILSCKKDSSSSTSKTDQITSADWKYDNGGIGDATGNIIVNFSTFGVIPSCSLDNTIHFNSNGSGTVSEGANVCSGAPATTPFTWNFSNNETVLNLSGGAVAGIGGSFKIKTLSSTQLSLLKDTTLSGVSGTMVVNLKH